MKFLHTADLHIGKKIFEQSLLEDQRYILERIADIALEEKVDAVVIAGDIYDRAVPPAEAVTLLDDFLTKLVAAKIPVIAISGNHDSPERVSFADRILEKQGLYLFGRFEEPLRMVTLEDEYGCVNFVCLPFVKPSAVRTGDGAVAVPESAGAVSGSPGAASSSAEAVESILGRLPMTLDLRSRYVLVTHFFVTGAGGENPQLSDSECDSQVGGLDSVPASLFQAFSYVALGHIHKPQHMGMGKVYYAGSPLKYSFGEAGSEKSVNIVELSGRQDKEPVRVRRVPLEPMRDMRCIRGKLADLISPEAVAANGDGLEDYLQVTLTDTEELVDPIGTLRSVYPNVLQILLEKNRQDDEAAYESRLTGHRKSTAQLFADFYEMLRGEPMDEKRRKYVEEAAAEAEENVR